MNRRQRQTQQQPVWWLPLRLSPHRLPLSVVIRVAAIGRGIIAGTRPAAGRSSSGDAQPGEHEPYQQQPSQQEPGKRQVLEPYVQYHGVLSLVNSRSGTHDQVNQIVERCIARCTGGAVETALQIVAQ